MHYILVGPDIYFVFLLFQFEPIVAEERENYCNNSQVGVVATDTVNQVI